MLEAPRDGEHGEWASGDDVEERSKDYGGECEGRTGDIEDGGLDNVQDNFSAIRSTNPPRRLFLNDAL